MPPDPATTDLAAALAVARTYAGLPFVSATLTVRLASGRTVTVEVGQGEESSPLADRPEGGRAARPLTDMQRAVLDVVLAMEPGDVLKTEEVARRAGHANSGPLRDYLKTLDEVEVTRSGVVRLPQTASLG